MFEKIFYPKPERWGLRGDPYLWDEMKDKMSVIDLPKDVKEFEDLIKKCFKELTGEKMLRGVDIYVERYSHGGMSSGKISSDFWIYRGLPLLKERFIEIKKEQS